MSSRQKILGPFFSWCFLVACFFVAQPAAAQSEYKKEFLCIPASDSVEKSCHFTDLGNCLQVKTRFQPYIYPCATKTLTTSDNRKATFCGAKKDTYNCYAQKTDKACKSKKGFCEWASISVLPELAVSKPSTATPKPSTTTTKPASTASSTNQPGSTASSTVQPESTGVPAVSSVPSSYVSLDNPLGNIDSPQKLIGKIINAVMGLIGSIALLMFIYGGFTWLTSAGNTDKVKKGKDILVWAAIGLAFIFSSYALVNLVINSLK